jgi:hypothetical protein
LHEALAAAERAVQLGEPLLTTRQSTLEEIRTKLANRPP